MRHRKTVFKQLVPGVANSAFISGSPLISNSEAEELFREAQKPPETKAEPSPKKNPQS